MVLVPDLVRNPAHLSDLPASATVAARRGHDRIRKFKMPPCRENGGTWDMAAEQPPQMRPIERSQQAITQAARDIETTETLVSNDGLRTR